MDARRLWVCLFAFGFLLHVVSAAPSLLADNHTKQLMINKETANPLEESSVESDADVKELHSWGLKESRTNGGVNYTQQAEAAESPVAEKEEKRGTLSDKVDLISEFTSSRDTPRDMAEYIFWTGDEKSVTSAIKDFVEQGLMTQSEGIAFLEEVRYYLIQMQQRYGNTAGALEAAVSSAESGEHRGAQDKLKYTVKEDNEDVEDLKMAAADASAVTSTAITSLSGGKNRQSIVKAEPTERAKPQGEIVVTSFGTAKSKSIIDPLIDEVVDDHSTEEKKPKAVLEIKEADVDVPLADLLNNEFTLEEIIYQLARILFTQSLNQAGNPEAEEALQKFADFLEKESNEGKLSPQLQKKVLDVLLMSLFDAMGDQKSAAGLTKMAVDLQQKRNLHDKH